MIRAVLSAQRGDLPSRRARRCLVVGLAALLIPLGAATQAVASTGPGTVLTPVTPVPPVVHRGYPCVIFVGGPFDQYIYVSGQTPQTRVGHADIYSAGNGELLWHRGLYRGYTVIHTSRGQVASSYRAKINGITCGPPA